MKWLIYKHTNKINGKVYIGQTRQNPGKRWDKGRGYATKMAFALSDIKAIGIDLKPEEKTNE